MRRAFNRPRGPGAVLIWDLLTFERLMTNTVVHLIYWAGLAIVGVLVMGALLLLWRSFCEFYVAIFKISEDLSALRADMDAEKARLPR